MVIRRVFERLRSFRFRLAFICLAAVIIEGSGHTGSEPGEIRSSGMANVPTDARRLGVRIGMSRPEFEKLITENPVHVHGYGTEFCYYQSGYQATFVNGVLKSCRLPAGDRVE